MNQFAFEFVEPTPRLDCQHVGGLADVLPGEAGVHPVAERIGPGRGRRNDPGRVARCEDRAPQPLLRWRNDTPALKSTDTAGLRLI